MKNKIQTKTLLALFTAVLLTSSFAVSAEVSISQKNKKFDKTTIKIKKGDSILFKNDEKDITHNVFSLGPKNQFELKTQAPGAASSIKFDDVSTTEVECAIHTDMKLKVTVE